MGAMGLGAVLLGSLHGTPLSIGPAQAEETVEASPPSTRTGGDVASKLHATRSPREAARLSKEAKLKETAAVDDPTLPLLAELRKPAEEQATAAAKKLGELGTARAVTVLLDELAIGLPPHVAKAALEAVAVAVHKAADAPDPFSILALYAHHRSPELRKQALTALSGLGLAGPATPMAAAAAPGAKADSPVVPLLLAALSDASGEVRAVAAQALGARHEARAEGALIKLLLRKDPAAPAALGQVGGPDTARGLAEMIGNVPDHMILETLGDLLARPDFGPEPVRVQVVKTIGKMPGSQTLDILSDYVKDTAKDKQRPSRLEAQKIIEQRTAK
jgi:hypothetical protein